MPIPPPTSDDPSRDTFLANLRLNGYKNIEPALIDELLAHPLAPYVQAGVHGVINAPTPALIALLVKTYERRRRVSLDTQTPDKSLATIIASLSALHQKLPDLYMAAATDPSDTMLTTMGLIALEEMKHPKTAAMARRLLNDPREFVRSTAASIVARVAPASAYDDLIVQLKKPKLDEATIVSTISALLATGKNDAANIAYTFLVKKPDQMKLKCAFDLAIRRPIGAGALLVKLYQSIKSESPRLSMLDAMGTLGDSDAHACMLEVLRQGSTAEATSVIDRLAGYEPRAGWHDELRATARQRGDTALQARIEDRITAARERDEMR